MLTALYADEKGEIYDAPGLWGGGMRRCGRGQIDAGRCYSSPERAELMYLPERSPLAFKDGLLQPVKGHHQVVAAMLPVGYTRTHLPAFIRQEEAPVLPLFGYTAAALYKDEIVVAAVKSDDNTKWHPYRYNTSDLKRRVAGVKRQFSGNPIVEQLAKCSLTWHCATAQNLFYRRWEAGIPVSPACNANCVGCISLQSAECCPSPQSRIAFAPAPEDIAAVGIYHLSTAPEGIVSFGQGCEGEPSLAGEVIAQGIKLIRGRTNRGIINMNTNAGFTKGIQVVTDAGIDSMRVSIISAIPASYQAYYRGNYTLEDVKASICYARKRGVYVSLNMLSFPGFNDRPEEIAAWKEFIAETDIQMIQLRNLNIDPDVFWQVMPGQQSQPTGVKPFLRILTEAFPKVAVGSFTRAMGNGQ